MKAIVVVESLWGNTLAVGRAIAEGIGEGAVAMTTSEATPALLEGVDLVVAGAPVHIMRLPSPKTREKARQRGERPGATKPDLGHVPMAEWVRNIPSAKALGAAFDTRIGAQKGGCSAAKIAGRLRKAGYGRTLPPERFLVERVADAPGSGVRLADGELDRARAWGRLLVQTISKSTRR
jgi:hypothetical protein